MLLGSSKKSGTGSTPPTSGRSVTSLAKDGATSNPCLVAKTVPKSRPNRRNDAVDTSLMKKKKEEVVIVEKKTKMDIESRKSEEKSYALKIIYFLFFILIFDWLFRWNNLILVV